MFSPLLQEMLKRRRNRKSDPGFSFRFALFVALIGIMVGFLLNLSLSSPSTPATPTIPTPTPTPTPTE